MTDETQKALDEARSAVLFARRTRAHHGKRTERDSPQRIEDLELALARLREAMKPLRTYIGRFPFGPQTSTAWGTRKQVVDASRTIQVERRKLWKMKPRRAAPAPTSP